MNKIGIIGALDAEVRLLKEKMNLTGTKEIACQNYYEGTLGNKQVVVAQCGIGKVNAAMAAQIMISVFNVDGLINVGVAGAISKELNVGDLVISTDLAHHDYFVPGLEPGMMAGMSESFFKADELLIENAKKAAEGNRIFVGRIVSGDQFVMSSEEKTRIWTNFSAYCTEMEGAAIAQTAFLNGVPFVVIRSISDKADEDAGVSFDTFVVSAAKVSSDLVEKMVTL